MSVVASNSGALHGDLLVDGPTPSPDSLFLGVVFSDGIVADGDHGHESDTHPTDNKDVALPPEHSLSTSKFPSRKLPEVLEDLGCSMNQSEGAAGMNPVSIQLLGQGNGVVVVIHE